MRSLRPRLWFPTHPPTHTFGMGTGEFQRTRTEAECTRKSITIGFTEHSRTPADNLVAEREGFEPPIRLPVCRISSAVHSTALPPLQTIEIATQSRIWPI